MKYGRSDKTGEIPEDLETEYDDQPEYSPLKEKTITGFISELFQNRIPLVLLGGGLLVLVFVCIVLFIPRGKQANDTNQINNLKIRIQNIEDRLKELNKIDEKLSWFASQDRKIDRLSRRVANLETLASLRDGKQAGQPDKTPAKQNVVKDDKDRQGTVDKPVQLKSGPRYYQVRAGDTLYSISRRFGLTVDRLRKLNKLALKASIYPGQKLLIAP